MSCRTEDHGRRALPRPAGGGRWRRLVAGAAAVAGLGIAAGPAAAADLCVGVDRAGCSNRTSAAAALGAAQSGDRVFLGAGDHAGPLTVDLGVALIGAGAGTRLAGGTPVLTVAGRAEALAVTGGVRTDPQAVDAVASVARLTVAGSVRATGRSTLDATAVAAPADAAAALVVDCAVVDGRGLTLTGTAPHAVSAGCGTTETATRVGLRSTVLTGADPVARTGAGAGITTVATAASAHAADPDAGATDRLEVAGLGEDPRPGPGSPLTDRGDAGPLVAPDVATGVPGEPFEDLAGVARMADGDGDGVVRRDVGAYELHPPAPGEPAGNVLANPGAEAADLTDAGTPAGWSGTFGIAAYGTTDLPTAQTGTALGAGARLFAGAGTASASILQRIDLGGAGDAVDAGTATATLSGLLGGYGADQDAIGVTAAFRDPEGHELGRLALGPVAPAERGNDTTLLPRAATGAIPARTRAIDVTVRGDRVAGGYTDAYADRLGLVLSVPGAPVTGPITPDTPINPRLKPFSGVSLLTAAPAFSRAGRSSVLVACASDTVGRCKGLLELRGSVTGGKAPTRIGRYAYFSVTPGRVQRVTVKLLAASRKALAKRTRLKARFVATAADTQGVQRRRVVPVRLRLPGARTAGSRRKASRRSTRGTPAARDARPAAPR